MYMYVHIIKKDLACRCMPIKVDNLLKEVAIDLLVCVALNTFRSVDVFEAFL